MPVTWTDPAARLALEALPYFQPFINNHFASSAYPSTSQYMVPRQALQHHNAQHHLAPKHSSSIRYMKALKSCPMSNTSSVPVSLGLVQLAIGSTSLVVQPYGPPRWSLPSPWWQAGHEGSGKGCWGTSTSGARDNRAGGQRARGRASVRRMQKKGEKADRILEVEADSSSTHRQDS